jgi:hypothetical protein
VEDRQDIRNILNYMPEILVSENYLGLVSIVEEDLRLVRKVIVRGSKRGSNQIARSINSYLLYEHFSSTNAIRGGNLNEALDLIQ